MIYQYSHVDDMGPTESEQRQQTTQWINNPGCPDCLKWLLKQVRYHFMTVESRMRGGDHAHHEKKCNELIEFIEHVYTSNKLFKWAKQKCDWICVFHAHNNKIYFSTLHDNCTH